MVFDIFFYKFNQIEKGLPFQKGNIPYMFKQSNYLLRKPTTRTTQQSASNLSSSDDFDLVNNFSSYPIQFF